MNVSGLKGVALFEKLANSSTLPVRVKERIAKSKEFKNDLEKGKNILSCWQVTAKTLGQSGILLEQQVVSRSAQPVGNDIIQLCKGSDDFIKSALACIAAKLTNLAKLKAKCQTLDNIGHNRNRFVRKREELRAKLAKKNKPVHGSPDFAHFSQEYEKAHWDFIELEAEVVAEYDFLIQESSFLQGGQGNICAMEIDLLGEWIQSVFRVHSKAEAGSSSENTAHAGGAGARLAKEMLRYTKDFFLRQESFVRREKILSVQTRLRQEGLVQNAASGAANSTSDSKKSSSSAPTDCVSPVTVKGLGARKHSSAKVTPGRPTSEGREFRSKKERRQEEPAAVNQVVAPAPPMQQEEPQQKQQDPKPKAPGPRPKSYRNVQKIPSENFIECDSEQPGATNKTSTSSGSSVPLGRFEELQNAGFPIAEMQQVLDDGTVLHWCEYVGRDTGDSYWLEATHKKICLDKAPCVFNSHEN